MSSTALKRLRGNTTDMTEGSIVRHILIFALPLLAGNIFQQLYNTVDMWVVGNFVSNEAFSAVGTVGPIINMLIGFFMGFSSGAGVVISQFFDAKQQEKVQEAVHTALVVTLILGVLFTGLGLAITPLMLRLINTPPEVLPQSSLYLTIYFSGIMGLMIYNMGSGILRAVGDSKRPFYFLIVSALLNIVLDLVFVLNLGMGVEGVALATILSQAVSAVLVLLTLFRSRSCVQVSLSRLRLSLPMLKKIVKVGFPAAIQMAITAFSNVFVQAYINAFGADVMSGWTAYSRVDQLLFLPMQSISLAATTFVGQNLGNNDLPRAKQGIRTALWMAILSTVLLLIPVELFAPQLTAFFNAKPEVVHYGGLLLRVISPFYVLCCINQIYASALRGTGDSRTPMLIMLSSFVAFRQLYLFIVSSLFPGQLIPLVMGYPAGWLLCSGLMLLYFSKAKLSAHRVVDDDPAVDKEPTHRVE